MAGHQPIRFGAFSLHGPTGPLYCSGNFVSLRAIPLRILWFLASRPGQLVVKDALLAAIWPNRVVSESNLTVSIREIRVALGEDSRNPRFLQTLHGSGYRFIGHIGQSQATTNPLTIHRSLQLEQLHESFTRALAGQCQLHFISANPGFGKTTLLHSFIDYQCHDARVLRGGCLDHSAIYDTYSPVYAALQSMANGDERDWLVSCLHDTAPGWLLMFSHLVDADERERLHYRTSSTNESLMRSELANLLMRLSRDKPLVLALDDMQWCDSATTSAILFLMEALREAPVLILLCYRQAGLTEHPALLQLVSRLRLQKRCDELSLPPFTLGEVQDYVRHRLADRFDSRLAAAIYNRSAGHPLFVAAMTEHLAETAEGSNGHLSIDSAVSDLPESLSSFIKLRMAELSIAECELLEVASVAGEVFAVRDIEPHCLQSSTNSDSAALLCESLARRGEYFLAAGTQSRPDGSVSPCYRFHHSLYPELIQSAIGSDRLARLHRDVASTIELAFENNHTSVVTQLAHHFEQGGDPMRATHYLKLAAGVASERFAGHEAVKLLQHGLSLLIKVPETPHRAMLEMELLLELGPVLITLQGYSSPEVDQVFSRARALCRLPALTPFRFPVLRGLAGFHHLRAEYQTASDLGCELLSIEPDQTYTRDDILLESKMISGVVDFFRGHFRQSSQSFQQACAIRISTESTPDNQPHGIDARTLSLAFDALNCWVTGDVQQSQVLRSSALDRATATEHPYTIAQCHALLALLHQLRADLEAARLHSDTAAALAQKHGFAYLQASECTRAGWLDIQQQKRTSLDRIERGIARYRETGAVGGLSIVLGSLAEACLVNEQPKTGMAAIDEALAATEKNGEAMYRAELFRLRGQLLLAAYGDDQIDNAASCFGQAIDMAEKQSARAFVLNATACLIRLERNRKRWQNARDLQTRVADDLPRYQTEPLYGLLCDALT